MGLNTDILQKLDTSQIIKLQRFYEGYKDDLPHIYNYLKTALQWQLTQPDYITIYSVNGDFLNDGTFIALNTFSCYDIFLHTKEESCEKLYKGLTKTKLINWTDYGVYFYAVYEKITPIVLQALKELNVPVKYTSTTYLWKLPREKALNLNDTFKNSSFYIDSVKPEKAEVINSVWPPSFETSLEYLRNVIKMNGGYGVYERGSDALVSWSLRTIIGIGVLQTLEGFLQRGFASAIIRKLAKVIAQNGDYPVAVIVAGNTASEKLFAKIGFEKTFVCNFIRIVKN